MDRLPSSQKANQHDTRWSGGRIALDSSDEEEAANEFEFEFGEEALDYADPE